MSTLSPGTDNAPTRHELLLAAGLEMAKASITRWPDLDPSGRRELLAVWTEFCTNLRALGVVVPTATATVRLEG
jgi:hypothetical protein